MDDKSFFGFNWIERKETNYMALVLFCIIYIYIHTHTLLHISSMNDQTEEINIYCKNSRWCFLVCIIFLVFYIVIYVFRHYLWLLSKFYGEKKFWHALVAKYIWEVHLWNPCDNLTTHHEQNVIYSIKI